MTSAANLDLVDRLSRQLALVSDPERAKAMAAYMRDQFPFLACPAPS